MDKHARDLDRYITGNYGEDQFKNQIHPSEEAWNALAAPHTTFTKFIFNAGWNAAIKAANEQSPDDDLTSLLIDNRE